MLIFISTSLSEGKKKMMGNEVIDAFIPLSFQGCRMERFEQMTNIIYSRFRISDGKMQIIKRG